MIELKFVFVGKTKESWIAEGLDHYEKMLRQFGDLEFLTVKDEKVTQHSSEKIVLEREGERILKSIEKNSYSIALDSRGKMISTEELAGLFIERMNQGYNNFVFVTGSALGLSPEVIRSADLTLSLSRMTFPHQLVRLILLEQVYRAFSIIGGRKYHK